MKTRQDQEFFGMTRNPTENHFQFYKQEVESKPDGDSKPENPWVRPFKTTKERVREVRKRRRKVRDFFEEFSLKNLGAMLKWTWSWVKHRLKRTHRFVVYPDNESDNGIYRMDAEFRILLASDWGTATPDAIAIGERMGSLEPKADITIHLGDVYYTGEEDEYRDYFFPYWPSGRHVEHPIFLLNANHEMYSGGHGYFNYAIRRAGQKASYFCLENDHWRIIGLDTGYHSVKADKRSVDKQDARYVKLPKALVKWLREKVFTDPNDTRGIILLSHHQWFCSFGTEYHRPAQQLLEWIQSPVLWFWGHEHVFAAYGLTEEVTDAKSKTITGIPVYARCIGHGGMPAQIERLEEKLEDRQKQGRVRDLILWDKRRFRKVNGTTLGYNGFVDLQFNGDRLLASYHDNTKVLLEEEWQATPAGIIGKVSSISDELEPEPGRTINELYGSNVTVVHEDTQMFAKPGSENVS
ncbi:hypothetical protein GWO43_29440 [candidate division KSB1 bacterium]|nr:hypothetical protein [candidate division KSB1 bacterium]NIR69886.1 hypothetical protein [candidate division KSB1 bacterium]NIS28039.1 hypothetical protein [candidate division KSB1 bacterium]NIT74910.1 hypothetical protein [candidate division KSB1 bacterium]NIU28694.1 hypothetical protein [candidate division KSB1 bacterium]